jgi:UDP-N-acetylglucosamine:LPS N-acetylglucosamine transferase
MAAKRVLFISGSLGLGHVVRDLAIARELREIGPQTEILWLASHPADEFLQSRGEKMVAGAEKYANDNVPAEKVARDGKLNLLAYLTQAKKEWKRNVGVFQEITSRERFDLVIGDETYEINIALSKKPQLKKSPFVMIYDFIGLYAMTGSPVEKIGIYLWNLVWSKIDKKKRVTDLSLFVGEEGDVPDHPFGFLLPNRRVWARDRCEFIGQIVRFDPEDYRDRSAVRRKLGYDSEPLIIGAVGGSSAGRPLLELFGKTYPILIRMFHNLHMVLVCGPRISPDTIKAPNGVEVAGFIPHLHEHFAACDLALTMGGGSSTLELTVLQRPFIYFPLQEHFEQERHVSPRVERGGVGVRMDFSETTPVSLARAIISQIGKEVKAPPVRIGGEKRAAALIRPLLFS